MGQIGTAGLKAELKAELQSKLGSELSKSVERNLSTTSAFTAQKLGEYINSFKFIVQPSPNGSPTRTVYVYRKFHKVIWDV
jgi:hypothetical protein